MGDTGVFGEDPVFLFDCFPLVLWEACDGVFQATGRLYNPAGRLLRLKEGEGRLSVDQSEEGQLEQLFQQTPTLAGITGFDQGLSVLPYQVDWLGEVGGRRDVLARV